MRPDDDPKLLAYQKFVGEIFFDDNPAPGRHLKVDRIEYDSSINPSTNEVVGWIASSVDCDVNGFVDPGKYVSDILIDTERQPYTLENNIEGYSIDDMIRAHRSRCV